MLSTKLYWDGYGIGRKGGGVYQAAERYYQELVKRGIHPRLIYSSVDPSPLGAEMDQLILQELPGLGKFTRSKVLWPRRVSRRLMEERACSTPKALFHGLSNFNVPLTQDFHRYFATVLTVHDLIPLLAPKQVSWSQHLQIKYLMPRLVPKVDFIVCPSKWTESSLWDFFPDSRGRTTVIPWGMSFEQKVERETFCPPESKRLAILTVGRYEPYKNIDKVVELVRQAKGDLELTLVTDSRGVAWAMGSARDLIDRQLLVVKTNLTSGELGNQYRRAKTYVHMSSFEGFGFPPHESIALGTPVVYQSGSAVGEHLNTKVAVSLSPTAKPTEWIDAIKHLAVLKQSEEFYKNRQDLLNSWPTWRESAGLLLEVYQKALS